MTASASLLVLSAAALPQTAKVFREGHARGLSWWYLWMLWVGFVTMILYTILAEKGLILSASYTVQATLFVLMMIRKRFPTSPSEGRDEGPREADERRDEGGEDLRNVRPRRSRGRRDRQ